jgi:hypothetical protein
MEPPEARAVASMEKLSVKQTAVDNPQSAQSADSSFTKEPYRCGGDERQRIYRNKARCKMNFCNAPRFVYMI